MMRVFFVCVWFYLKKKQLLNAMMFVRQKMSGRIYLYFDKLSVFFLKNWMGGGGGRRTDTPYRVTTCDFKKGVDMSMIPYLQKKILEMMP